MIGAAGIQKCLAANERDSSLRGELWNTHSPWEANPLQHDRGSELAGKLANAEI